MAGGQKDNVGEEAVKTQTTLAQNSIIERGTRAIGGIPRAVPVVGRTRLPDGSDVVAGETSP